jgi:hypothetical protein
MQNKYLTTQNPLLLPGEKRQHTRCKQNHPRHRLQNRQKKPTTIQTEHSFPPSPKPAEEINPIEQMYPQNTRSDSWNYSANPTQEPRSRKFPLTNRPNPATAQTP